MKIIPFYLPQYHAIRENDEWWGEGFTEWTNVRNARPLYEGHRQPKVPLDDNYYCLLEDSVKEWQIKIARENGIYGFCFYHYWFNGKLLLEQPILQYLKNPALDFPFCLCWANPDWTKIWAGKGSEVLIRQDYSDEADLERHFQFLLPFFRDERYIREEGKPVFVIYSPEEIPNLKERVDFLRKRIVQEGFPGICLFYQYVVSAEKEKEIKALFDYKIRFQPVHALHEAEASSGGMKTKLMRAVNDWVQKLTGIQLSDYLLRVRRTDYDAVWEKILSHTPEDRKEAAGAFVNWDNTPRRGNAGRVIEGGTPEKFRDYMKKLIRKIKAEYSNEYLFLTAWNEWSEGSYLEPDKENGYAYLKALKEAASDDE